MFNKCLLTLVLFSSSYLLSQELKEIKVGTVPIIQSDTDEIVNKKDSDKPIQIINNYYGVNPISEVKKKNDEYNHSFSFNLGGSEILGIEYGYFPSKNFEWSLGLGIIPPLSSGNELDDEVGEDLAGMGIIPLVNLKLAYYIDLNENNKFFVGLFGTYVIVPGVFFGYELISDGGFFFKIAAYYSIIFVAWDLYFPIPAIAIGSRF